MTRPRTTPAPTPAARRVLMATLTLVRLARADDWEPAAAATVLRSAFPDDRCLRALRARLAQAGLPESSPTQARARATLACALDGWAPAQPSAQLTPTH